MTLLDSLPDRCTISRRSTDQGALAGTKTVVNVEQTNVVCWDQNATHAEIREFDKRGMRIGHKIFFVNDPLVSERHIIQITTRKGVVVVDDPVLEVRSEAEPDTSAGTAVLYKVIAEERTGRDS